ncbi:MAG: hypothetical protein INQ03_04430 [Candidatus Heimdallarchaeota archaeon]|nr:hypothetical protein [Candidatus Heimdallarchaeota archaeon]
MATKGPRMTEISKEDLEKEIRESEREWNYRDAAIRGLITGGGVYFIELIAAIIVMMLYFEPLVMFYYFNAVLGMEVVIFFLLSSTSIWFIPSPSWNQFKASLFNKPYIPKSTTEAWKVGLQRAMTAIVFLMFFEIHRQIIIHFL